MFNRNDTIIFSYLNEPSTYYYESNLYDSNWPRSSSHRYFHNNDLGIIGLGSSDMFAVAEKAGKPGILNLNGCNFSIVPASLAFFREVLQFAIGNNREINLNTFANALGSFISNRHPDYTQVRGLIALIDENPKILDPEIDILTSTKKFIDELRALHQDDYANFMVTRESTAPRIL